MKKIVVLLSFVAVSLTQLYSQNYAFDMNAKLGMGINLGNAYEATDLGEWGVNVDSSYFSDIKAKGFSSVRIPARWSAHALPTLPYTISEYFMDTIQWVINQAISNGLYVVLDVHHYDEMFVDPYANKERFLSFWQQIGNRFEGYTDSLYFEVMNEPHDDFTPTIWNEFLLDGIETIRVKHPTRMLIIGTAEYGGIGGLQYLEIPETDTALIVTVHYYNPFDFTHQGADFAGITATGVTWDSTATQIQAVKNDMDIIQAYSEAHNVPIYIGEFGAIQNADDSSRATWAGHLRKTFESYGFSAAYWEYCSGFGIYDAALDCYYNGLIKALTDSVGACDCAMYDTIIVKNSDFTRGSNAWVQYEYAASGASGNFEVVNEEARLEIIESGDEEWHVQLVFGTFPMVLGSTYTFTFDAYASSPTAITAQTSREGGDYSVINGFEANLTTTKQTFSNTFTIDVPTIQSARLVFECGLANAQYLYFDNVHIYEIEAGVPVESITITDETMTNPTIINAYQDSVQLETSVLPLTATNTDVIWSIVSGASFATITSTGMVKATGTGNGTVVVKALAYDGSGVYAQKTIYVRNQNTEIADISKKCSVIIEKTRYNFEGNYIESVEIYDVLGKKCGNLSFDKLTQVVLPNYYFPQNMYFIKVKTNRTTSTVKYFKK